MKHREPGGDGEHERQIVAGGKERQDTPTYAGICDRLDAGSALICASPLLHYAFNHNALYADGPPMSIFIFVMPALAAKSSENAQDD